MRAAGLDWTASRPANRRKVRRPHMHGLVVARRGWREESVVPPDSSTPDLVLTRRHLRPREAKIRRRPHRLHFYEEQANQRRQLGPYDSSAASGQGRAVHLPVKISGSK